MVPYHSIVFKKANCLTVYIVFFINICKVAHFMCRSSWQLSV